LTDGNVVKYRAVFAYITALPALLGCEIVELAFDPWNATGLVTDLQETGLTCVAIQQGFKTLTSPTKEVERLVKTRQLRHGNHPVLRWCANNVVTEEDDAGNLKPSKRKSTERIDGIVALITGLSRAILEPADRASVYDTRGVLAF
jgi:phage terminase large subunit-like protein